MIKQNNFIKKWNIIRLTRLKIIDYSILLLINLKIIPNKNKEYNHGSLQSREYNITFIIDDY